MTRRTLTFLTAFALSLLAAVSVHAQGSPYSFIGFGDEITATSARLMALSGTGAALADGAIVNEVNPAGFSFINKSALDLRLRFSFDRSQLAGDETDLHLIKLGGIVAGTHVSNALQLGIALGFTPVTDAEAQTTREDSLGQTIYKRQGGLSQFFIGAGFRPFSALAIGARLDVLFGNVTTQSQASILGDDVIAGVFQRGYSESGLRGTFGFMLSLDSIFPELKGLTIGASYATAASLTSSERTVVTPVSSTLDSILQTPGYGYYPSEIKLGLATRLGERMRVEANLSGVDFTNAYVYSPDKNPTPNSELGPSNRYSIGFERMALSSEESRGVSFWTKTALRLGFSYAQLPYRPAPGVTVSEMSGSLGLGIPLPSGSAIDIGAVLGIRTPSNTDVAPKELFFKLSGSMTISERWFIPTRKTDDD